MHERIKEIKLVQLEHLFQQKIDQLMQKIYKLLYNWIYQKMQEHKRSPINKKDFYLKRLDDLSKKMTMSNFQASSSSHSHLTSFEEKPLHSIDIDGVSSKIEDSVS